ncbi:MAG TPA: CehA/McbA family metallohydrolase [Hyphomonadaceae bacterium]|nr:CehA/McbA family metallohydrolase [Hyphomonadaceae bacterium]HPN04764.1 CehA/McbA family metallohydrolase [Hyphomonadaceae bacterium]
MRHVLIPAAFALTACVSTPASAPEPTTVSLTGQITGADHQTYRELPFVVPAGTHRITIDFSYDKENRTVIDLGLRDPQGQRGWSGGNKTHIEIGDSDATPSYQPAPIQPGEWKLVLGIPNIREGQTSPYKADITFSPDAAPAKSHPAFAATTLVTGPAWRRGDFHMHTAHSDASCDVDAARAPCPSIHTFEAARDANLDFVAITDHNTITQLADIAAQQAAFPKTLLIPGTEITTFNGHANVIGNTDFLDFQLGSPRLPTLGKLLDQADAAGAFVSVNHPGLPSGEVCMGCGWTVKDTDWSRVTAIEVANGSSLRQGGPAAGLRFWDDLLKQGYRLTAIGGSDNHDATDRAGAKQPPIGYPTTAVYSSGLSTKAIIEGVRSGRVFIDLANTPAASLDLSVHVGLQTTRMGGRITLGPNEAATVDALVSGQPAGATLTLIAHNLTIDGAAATQIDNAAAQVRIALTPGATHAYLRPEIRDAAGKILMIGNAIYVGPR